MPITQSLVREIEDKQRKIATNPDYYLLRDKRIKSYLSRVAKVNSWWIENPVLRHELLKRKAEERIKHIALVQTGMQNLMNAWSYVAHTPDFLTERAVLETGALVEPQHNQGDYRRDRVFLKGLKYVPPNPLKVPELVKKTLDHLQSSHARPIERAITAHLHLAGIQPLNEGNKRTARLYQDRILFDADLPPAFIPAGERHVYIDLLDDALVDIGENKTTGQRNFYDYIGGKVNTGLDVIIHDLHEHERYLNHRHNGHERYINHRHNGHGH